MANQKQTEGIKQVLISNRNIGHLILDITQSEQHSSQLKITENPIEHGAAITDHSVITPMSLSISGIVVDYEPMEKIGERLKNYAIRGSKHFLDNVWPVEGITKARPQSEPIQADEKPGYVSWNNNEYRSWLKDHSQRHNRIQRIYDDFLSMQKLGQPIEINTGIKLYKNMLIESLSVSQNNDGVAEFSINAREIFIVKSKVIEGVMVAKIEPGKTSGRGSSQAADKEQIGRVNPEKQ